ncbi:hypothetical protein HBN50_14540 [Halobacteriovorax sp. GB3]|uniref:hypothetical protein n=1 Tax=Halobacteriovorax sp. GB3 TaxID=2719615 RepID=UPI002362C974|nr:hypothetical protein [Halobacteriovorax sp. GB3]MDD0854327.1 hypothetical protein [Halobacteriovorax sp. GB3]
MLRIMIILIACTNFSVFASTLLSNVQIDHKRNKTDFNISWDRVSGHSFKFGKIFLCNENDCIESSSGEFRVDRSIRNEKVFFEKSFYGNGHLNLVVKGIGNRGELVVLYDRSTLLKCDEKLFAMPYDGLVGPIDLNCDGSIDVLSGHVNSDSLAKVYPLVITKENNEEVSFTSDQRIVIDRNADASNFLGQSCKVKIVTKKYFNGEQKITMKSGFSSNDPSPYEIPMDVSIRDEDCSIKNGVSFCSRVVDLCFERPFYYNSNVMKKGYDSREYAVEIEGKRVGTYRNKCSVNYKQEGREFDPKKKDGLDNDCNGELDDVQSYKNYCLKVDSRGRMGICTDKCLIASTKHDVNVFRFPKLCESYGNRFPLWASSTKRERKFLCFSRSESENSFADAIKKCHVCSRHFSKEPNSSNNTIVDKCGNYSGVKGYKSRAVYTNYTADYENCEALLRCDKWAGGTIDDPVYY